MSFAGVPRQHTTFSDLIAWSEVRKIKDRNNISMSSAASVYAQRLTDKLGRKVTKKQLENAVCRITRRPKKPMSEIYKSCEKDIDIFLLGMNTDTESEDEIKIPPWLAVWKRQLIENSNGETLKLSREYVMNIINFSRSFGK